MDSPPTVNHNHLYQYTINFHPMDPMDQDYIVRCQSDQVNTKESVLPVCDYPYHMNKRKVQKGRKLNFCGTVHYEFVLMKTQCLPGFAYSRVLEAQSLFLKFRVSLTLFTRSDFIFIFFY